jgi:hypothetical protein
MSELLQAAIGQLGATLPGAVPAEAGRQTFAEIQTQLEARSINTVYTWDARCRKQLWS